MKKRGQFPSVQTFTIIFRGLARSQHPQLAVAEAVKHYNLLMADKRIQPNSIHLNAVLNVCARAGDLESMFLIADTADDSARAPTAYTYATVLNALRHQVLRDRKELPPDQQAANVQRTVNRAKGLWTEALGHWTEGRMVMDEELVCAMGRLLLLSPRIEEKREVLDLLHQTMKVPNLAKMHGAAAADSFDDPAMRNIAADAASGAVATARPAAHAVPGRNALALVLSTLASTKLTTVGIKYWNLMVRHYGIVPDGDNWLRMLGMLKVAKASAHAAAILALIPDEHIDPKVYRIAMETCVRDNINQNAVANADAVLDSMAARLRPAPDLHALRLYLRVALVSHFHFRAAARSGDAAAAAAAKRQYGAQIGAALDRLWEPYKQVHYHYFKAAPRPATPRDEGILRNDRREVIALARLMFSALNKVINEQMLPQEELRRMRPVGAKINREIQNFYADREQVEPKLASKSSSPSSPSSSSSSSSSSPPAVKDPNTDEMESHGHRSAGDFVWDTTKLSPPPYPSATQKQARTSHQA